MQIFHEAYIPRRLIEVEDYEGDFERLHNAGADENLEGIYYQTLAGASRLSPKLISRLFFLCMTERAYRLLLRPGTLCLFRALFLLICYIS